MRRRDVVRELKKMGCVLIRDGGKHDWYQNPTLAFLSQFRVTESLKILWQSIFSRCLEISLGSPSVNFVG